MCNKQAMDCLHKNNYADAIRMLQKATQILTNLTPTYTVIKLKAVTLNNLGCLYKRGNDNAKALHYLAQALDYESRLPEEFANMAGTHLNMCAIKSHLNDHDDALNHALKAINIIQRNYNGQKDFTTTLVAAYHNAGVEYQFLNRKIEANNFFRQGFDLAVKKLGKSHPLTKNLENFAGQIRKNQLENIENNSKEYENSMRSRDLRMKEESIFKPESSIFTEDTPVRKINVDTTPWPKSTSKQQWPSKIESLKLSEITPKPYKIRRSERELSYDSVKKINEPTLPYTERKINPRYLNRNSNEKTIEKNKSDKNYSERSPEKTFIEKTKSENIQLVKNPSEKPKPNNIHLHHTHTIESKASFKSRTKIETPLAKSLNSSPSKSSSFKNSQLNSKKNIEVSYINPEATVDKINSISQKLENLQEKLDSFEQNFKKLKTLNEEDESESIVSTKSVVNVRRHQAAILIQKHFRRYLKQKAFTKEKKAAIHIQKIAKGYTTRKKIHREIYKSEDFSQQFCKEPCSEPLVIRTSERGNQTDKVPKKTNAVITLVSSTAYRPTRKKRTLLQNIVMIQAHFRRCLAKKICQKRTKAIKTLQRASKMFRIKSIYQKIISAIIFIQAVYRGHLARKYAKTILPKGVDAKLRSQKIW